METVKQVPIHLVAFRAESIRHNIFSFFKGEKKMNETFGTPVLETPKKNNTVLIVVIVVVVLCCCCAVFGGAGWYLWNNGDALLNSMGAINSLI
jgi:hypothetical protein